MILVTLLLNILCKKGLGTIAWMLVFIPFILMTLISVILIIVFGLNPAEGDYTVDVIDEDQAIAGQRFTTMSFLSPEKILTKREIYIFDQ